MWTSQASQALPQRCHLDKLQKMKVHYRQEKMSSKLKQVWLIGNRGCQGELVPCDHLCCPSSSSASPRPSPQQRPAPMAEGPTDMDTTQGSSQVSSP